MVLHRATATPDPTLLTYHGRVAKSSESTSETAKARVLDPLALRLGYGMGNGDLERTSELRRGRPGGGTR